MLYLSKPSRANQVAKNLAKPISKIVLNGFFRKPVRLLDIYLSFIQGKGAGTGWDLKEEITIAQRFIKRDRPIVFDIGANVGDWSAYFLQTMPSAKIYIVEPVKECQKDILALNLPNATLIPYAVGDRASTGLIHTPSRTAGIASLYPRRDTYCQDQNPDFHTLPVEITTIDAIIKKYGIDFVDFLKMDIEGNEYNALLGAKETLSQQKIGAFSFEFGSGNINSRVFFHDLWDLISPKFNIYRMTPAGILLEIDEYYEDLEYFRGASNYIAVLKS